MIFTIIGFIFLVLFAVTAIASILNMEKYTPVVPIIASIASAVLLTLGWHSNVGIAINCIGWMIIGVVYLVLTFISFFNDGESTYKHLAISIIILGIAFWVLFYCCPEYVNGNYSTETNNSIEKLFN